VKNQSLEETVGTLLVLLTALISGISIVANKIFVLKVEPVILTSVRALILVPLGIVGGGLAFLLFFSGLALTTSGRAAFIHKTLPIWAAVAGFLFLKEKLSSGHILAVMIGMTGLTLMESGVLSSSLRLGDILALSATLLWAVDGLMAKSLLKTETAVRVGFGRMFFGSVFLFGVAGLQGKLGLLLSLTPLNWLYISISTLLLGAYTLTWYAGLKRLSLSRASGFLLLSPVISLVLGIVFLGETAGVLQLAGSGLILLGCGLLLKSSGEGTAHP
jgi:O-acetylserine/cysteine efflux transporter